MASWRLNSLAGNLLNVLNKYMYCKYVHYLGVEDGYSRKEFWESNLPDKYWLNIGPMFKNKTTNDDNGWASSKKV